MVDTATGHFALVKPENWASADTWGTKLNSNMDAIDNILYTIQTQAPNAAVVAAAQAAPWNVPIQGCVFWYVGAASLSSLPTNWAVCDGTRGTPDLRDRFLIGAGLSFTAGQSGGSASFTPTITVAAHQISIAEMPGHDHGYSQSPHSHGGVTDYHDHGFSQSPHGHTFSGYGGAGGGFQGGTGVVINSGAGTSANNANISFTGQQLGIGTDNRYANISFGAQGGWAAHGHAGSYSNAVPLYPPFVAGYWIMRLS
jgi:hypothetical protein